MLPGGFYGISTVSASAAERPLTSSGPTGITDGSKAPRSITAEMLLLYEPSTLSRTSPTSLEELERIPAAAHPCQTSKATPRRQSMFEPVRETSKRRIATQAAGYAWKAVKRAALRVREVFRGSEVLRRT